jgi:hypothetical protein
MRVPSRGAGYRGEQTLANALGVEVTRPNFVRGTCSETHSVAICTHNRPLLRSRELIASLFFAWHEAISHTRCSRDTDIDTQFESRPGHRPS